MFLLQLRVKCWEQSNDDSADVFARRANANHPNLAPLRAEGPRVPAGTPRLSQVIPGRGTGTAWGEGTSRAGAAGQRAWDDA